MSIAYPKEEVVSEFKLEPQPDANFTGTNCSHCRLFPASPVYDKSLGSCTGLQGEFHNTIKISVPETPESNDQHAALETTTNAAQCDINKDDKASDAVLEYLWEFR